SAGETYEYLTGKGYPVLHASKFHGYISDAIDIVIVDFSPLFQESPQVARMAIGHYKNKILITDPKDYRLITEKKEISLHRRHKLVCKARLQAIAFEVS